jgi:leader peptidase (prepilin peptidase)/N-methyltransferase
MMTEWILTLGAFVIGAVVGSFLNVVIYRIPKGENIAFPSSHCTVCGTPLKWYHNIPVLSWLILKGKCAFCGAPISKRYPIVEIVTGILFVLLYWKVGLTWYLPFVWASFAALLALVVIDFDYMAVPDSVNFAALVFALINPHFVQSAVDAAIAAGGLYLIGLLSSWIARKEAMGGADVIVAGTMGALLGFPNFFIAIFLSAVLAIIPALIKRDTGVPFVPFLALATLIVYLYDKRFETWLEWIIYG